MLKWWLLFVFDSAAVVSALWATFLFFAAERIDVSSDGTPPTWEADGFMAVGCICALERLPPVGTPFVFGLQDIGTEKTTLDMLSRQRISSERHRAEHFSCPDFSAKCSEQFLEVARDHAPEQKKRPGVTPTSFKIRQFEPVITWPRIGVAIFMRRGGCLLRSCQNDCP
jgi:hypothetical protein